MVNLNPVVEKEVKGGIVSILKEHPEGLTIEDLATLLKKHRQTITKYMLELKGAGLIFRRRVGSATLHYYTGTFEKKFSVKDLLEALERKEP